MSFWGSPIDTRIPHAFVGPSPSISQALEAIMNLHVLQDRFVHILSYPLSYAHRNEENKNRTKRLPGHRLWLLPINIGLYVLS